MMTRCVRPRAGALWPAALPMIPYMRANLARKRRGLAGADAIVAVSSTIAADLRARAPEIARHADRNDSERRRHRGPPGDRRRVRAAAAGPVRAVPRQAGAEQGRAALVPTVERADLDWPLVIAGDGPERTRSPRLPRAPIATSG